jgi:hypothetical protein
LLGDTSEFLNRHKSGQHAHRRPSRFLVRASKFLQIVCDIIFDHLPGFKLDLSQAPAHGDYIPRTVLQGLDPVISQHSIAMSTPRKAQLRILALHGE